MYHHHGPFLILFLSEAYTKYTFVPWHLSCPRPTEQLHGYSPTAVPNRFLNVPSTMRGPNAISIHSPILQALHINTLYTDDPQAFTE
ncbi:hypothetical protein BDZ89DRAFT_1023650, partial [Hymenopellis radicata]